MDRSRRSLGSQGDPEAPSVPASSRLTVRRKNRRRPASVWSRVKERTPRPRTIIDACGRAVRRGIPVIVATCAVTLLGSGLWLGYQFVTTSDRFAIDDIEIHGTVHTTPEQLRAAAPVQVGDNVFTADLGELATRLRAEPWIASAEARRVLPDKIVVDIREHEAAAVVSLPTTEGDRRYLADANGQLFKRVAGTEGDRLPLVSGLARDAFHDPAAASAGHTLPARQIVAALDVLRSWNNDERPYVHEIHLDAHGGFSLREGSLSVELGEGQLASRLVTFDAVWRSLTRDERQRVKRIHLGSAGELGARFDHVTVALD